MKKDLYFYKSYESKDISVFAITTAGLTPNGYPYGVTATPYSTSAAEGIITAIFEWLIILPKIQ